MDRIPKPGERYRHFKNKLYQVIAVATHSETGEQMVVYQALYGEYGIWVRPLELFLERVDREKYPDAEQEYRFERASGVKTAGKASGVEAEASGGERSRASASEREEQGMHPLLLQFLDTDSVAERLALLQEMKGKVGQREVDSLCFCLDVKPMEGDLTEQLDGLRQCIRMQQRYDAPRLRRNEWD